VFLGMAHNKAQRFQEDLVSIGKEVITLVAQKKIDPLVKEIITLEEIQAGLRKLSSRHLTGKIVAKLG
jgi:D-arabinose 1-dehydrogenase-like Zn-dependent alcohol dehydrogenase